MMQNEANYVEKDSKFRFLTNFLIFQCLKMMEIADYDGINCSQPLDNLYNCYILADGQKYIIR